MMIHTDNPVTVTEANRNASRAAQPADESGAAIILKKNAPHHVLNEFSQPESEQNADEDVLTISRRLMAYNKEAYEALAE